MYFKGTFELKRMFFNRIIKKHLKIVQKSVKTVSVYFFFIIYNDEDKFIFFYKLRT